MNSFIGWVGGKRALRKKIISEMDSQLNNSKTYVEVFGGAGWVLFAKPQIKNQKEVYNDFNSNLVNLFRCIKYHAQAVIDELEFLIPAKENFCDFKSEINCTWLTDIQRAARFFYLIKTSFGCRYESFATSPKRFDITLKRLKEVQQRLATVVVENRDFEGLIKLYDSEDTLFYLDPPYHTTEKYYDAEFSANDHERLRNLLKNIKGKFILSYNDDEFIRELYQGFNITEVSRSSTLNAKAPSNYKELIIKNY